MVMIGYCRLCKDKVILNEELQACSCGNFIANIVGETGEPEAAGGNAVIVKMDEDKIISLCETAGMFEENVTIVIDPTFRATHPDDDTQQYEV